MIGAAYLDKGFDACRGLVQTLYLERLATISPETHPKDPKTRLQEYLQAQKRPLPSYTVTAIEGNAHLQIFKVECVVDGISPCRGEGNSRRVAEQTAAQQALQLLGSE